MDDEDEVHLRSTFGDDEPPAPTEPDELDCLYCGGLALGRVKKE